MAENQTPTVQKSKRDLFGERLKNKYPDREYADDDALFGQIEEDYTDYDNQLNQFKEREQKLSDMFSNDPRSAHFLVSWSRGEHPMTAFIRQFGKDGLEELVNNEEKMEEFAKANEDYWERVTKEKELEEEYQKNLEESLAYLDKFQSENGMTDEEVDKVMEFLIGISRDGVMGKFSPESIDMAMKSINHDTDVSVAGTEGEIRGRNSKIEEKLRKPNSAGDGMPNLAGSNNAPTRQQKRNMNIFDYADAAK